MKKQFQNIRNFVQDLNRGDKSDVLPTEVLLAEKRVELIKQVCQLTEKRISGCLRSSGSEPTTDDRKLRKIPEFQLYQALSDSSDHIGTDSVFGQTLQECASSQHRLSQAILKHESEVEDTVVKPLSGMVQNAIPVVTKSRKTLNKATQDMETCRQKYQAALKASHQSNGPAIIAATNKAESLKKEWDESSYKVDQNKDIFASDVFSLLSREPELSHLFFQYLKLQAAFHKQASEQLEAALPVLQEIISNSSQKPLFGSPLEDHLRVTGREVALVIEACVGCLLHNLNEEGLFRIPGSSSKVKKLKSGFDVGIVNLEEQINDPHSVAGTLKSYLRELPEPLLTLSLYSRWIEAAKITDASSRLKALWKVVHDLPKENFLNLRYLVKFLDRIVQLSAANKMSSQNLAIAMAPSLIWSPTEDRETIGVNMTAANHHSVIVDCLISNCDWFFPGDVDLVAIPFQHLQESTENGTGLFKSTNDNHECVSPISQPPSRKAPRKPAPPVPPFMNSNVDVSAPSQELLRMNNNEYYDEGKKISPLPLTKNGGNKPSFRNSSFATGSSSETIDSCGSRSPVQNGEIGSLDRRGVIRRNSSGRRPADRNSIANYRASKLMGKPSVPPPPSSTRRPNVPPPERPKRANNELSRQLSADNLFDEYSSQTMSQQMSKSCCVRSFSQDETKDGNEEKEEGGDGISQVENNVIRLELNTGIETPECEKNDETLVTSRMNSTEEHKVPLSEDTSYETKIAALPPDGTSDLYDVHPTVTSGDLFHRNEEFPSSPESGMSDNRTLSKPLNEDLYPDQVKVKPPKPLPPPIKPRMNSLNEASRL